MIDYKIKSISWNLKRTHKISRSLKLSKSIKIQV